VALARRKPTLGLVHHSDRGVQYTSLSFGKRLEDEGLLPSMGRVGFAYGNALAKSFVATLKTELLYGAAGIPAGGEDRSLRVYRRPLQHEAKALHARLFEPCRFQGG